MFNPDDAKCAAFDTAFAHRARHASAYSVRSETSADRAFLRDLFIRCSPLADLLPPPMLEQQAELQDRSHRREFPAAMRRILLIDREPAGHVVIDWAADASHCVDIAVLPQWQRAGMGRHLLESWLDVADTYGAAARLTVRCDNPALRLYQRLGFVPAPDADAQSLNIAMCRQPDAARG